jgi:hypothetical protein
VPERASKIGLGQVTRIRYRPDLEKIKHAVENEGVRHIPGVEIFQVWTFKIDNRKLIPMNYKIAGDG